MRYRSEIDGLRAIAVVPVMLFHAGFDLFSGGYVGVDVFFVISGYLITSIILSELDQGIFSLVRFYERRARRILPALFFVMAVCLPFAWIWLLPSDFKNFSQSMLAVTTFSSNILFWIESGYFDTASELKPLLHTWSLAVEEHYYILVPLFFLLTWRFGKKAIIAVLAVIGAFSLAAAHWGAFNYPSATFYLLPTRGWEILLGTFIAFYEQRFGAIRAPNPLHQILSGLGLAMIALAVFSFDAETPFPSLYALLPTLGTVLIVLYAQQGSAVHSLLSSRILVGVGLISYSAYLWHQPVFAFVRHRSLTAPSASAMIGLILLSLVLAYFSWKFVETPFRKKAGRIGRRQLVISASVSMSCFIALGVAGHVSDGAPGRFDPLALKAYSEAKAPDFYWDNCMNGSMRHPVRKCISDTGSKKVVLLGDSHAAKLAEGLSGALVDNGSQLYVAAKPGCPPLTGFRRASNRSEQCSQFNESVLSYISGNPDVEWVILSAHWTLYATAQRFDNSLGGIEQGLTIYYYNQESESARDSTERQAAVINGYLDFVRRLTALGKKVIWVDQIPSAGWDVPARYMLLSKLGELRNEAFSYPLSAYDAYSAPLSTIRAFQQDRFYLVRPSEVLCSSGTDCTPVLLPTLYYDDNNHLSKAGADLVARLIAEMLAGN